MIFLDLTSRVKVFIWSFMSRRRIYIYIPLYFISILFKFFFLYLYINIFSFMSFSNFNNCSSELPIIFHQVNITLTISFLSPFLTLSLLQCLSLSLMLLLLLWFLKIRKVAEESTGWRSSGWWEVNWDRWDDQ